MRNKIFCVLGLVLAAPAASAQFSVTGSGAGIPASGTGGGGTYPSVLPINEATSTVVAPAAVTTIGSLSIQGLSHTWAGDMQITLSDPAGVEHLIMLRPGYLNTSNFGTTAAFVGGTYTFVESGGAALPSSSGNTADIQPDCYNQTFSSGGTTWNSGDAGILNTPLSAISGPAGTWTLKIYDWAGGDSGSFSGWTLNANGATGGACGPTTAGNAYCFGDGSGTLCPCAALGGTGEGCLTTSGTGARLDGSGNAAVGNDGFVLSVSGGPANKPGIFFQGTVQVNGGMGNFNGDGILCTFPQMRYDLNSLDANGEATQTGFGVNATAGQTMNYQYWFRDPANGCGGLFNFSNGWSVAWN